MTLTHEGSLNELATPQSIPQPVNVASREKDFEYDVAKSIQSLLYSINISNICFSEIRKL